MKKAMALIRADGHGKKLMCALAIGLSGGCAGLEGGDNDLTTPLPETTRLMDAYAQASRVGDFEGAWRTYTRLFEHLRDSNSETRLFEEYCSASIDCPAIAEIAWILGKPKAEIAVLDELGCLDGKPDPSCERWDEWAEFRKSYLADSASPPTHQMQELSIEFIHMDPHNDPSPTYS